MYLKCLSLRRRPQLVILIVKLCQENNKGEMHMLGPLQGQARYLYALEHQALPGLLFSKTKAAIITILQSKGACFVSWLKTIQEEVGDKSPVIFEEKDFVVKPILASSKKGEKPDIGIIQIQLPCLEESTLCPRVYICHDKDFGRPQYYTVEHDFSGIDMLCGWDAKHNHLNYGWAENTEQKEFSKILEMYTNSLQETEAD